jgi:putative transposase
LTKAGLVGSIRTGYRHGQRLRTLTTSLGATTIAMPRARIEDDYGRRREWRSQIIPRYQRRTERVDEAILGVYLSGTNTRRLRGALAPLLRGAPLSKDAVSRLMGRLREDFAAWAQRDLGALRIRYLFLDGWYPRVRIGKKRVPVPVLVTLGVCADGRRVVLDLRLAGVESEHAWLDALRSLAARNLGAPRLAVIDGNPGLAAALKVQWSTLAIQRCTNHKLWNLLAKAPAHLREELAEDYRRMIYATSREGVEQARVGFLRKWKLRAARRSASASRRLVTNSSPSPISHPRSGKRCGPPTRWNGSTRSFAGGPKPRLRCPVKRPCCSCSSASCAAVKCGCAVWSAGRIWRVHKWRQPKQLHTQLLARRWLMPITFPPMDRHHRPAWSSLSDQSGSARCGVSGLFGRLLEENNARQGFVDHAQLREHLPKYLKDRIAFLYLSEWRLGEMKELEWRDVDLAGRVVRLRSEISTNTTAASCRFLESFWRLSRARNHLADWTGPTYFTWMGNRSAISNDLGRPPAGTRMPGKCLFTIFGVLRCATW